MHYTLWQERQKSTIKRSASWKEEEEMLLMLTHNWQSIKSLTNTILMTEKKEATQQSVLLNLASS